jgi:hypothetical protein
LSKQKTGFSVTSAFSDVASSASAGRCSVSSRRKEAFAAANNSLAQIVGGAGQTTEEALATPVAEPAFSMN